LGASSATNTGQWQDNFQIVIAGSNVYQATEPAAIDGFSGPVNFGTSTINAPSGYMGVQTFPQSQPYDPSVCAAACNAKTAFDIQQGLPSMSNPDLCEFFVAYILYENGNNGVFTCTYYTSSWDSSYATNNGQYDGQGNHYTIGYSHAYAKNGAPINGQINTCGARGDVNESRRGLLHAFGNAATIDACRQNCAADQNCLSYVYSPTNDDGYCITFSGVTTKSSYTPEANGQWYFYDKACSS